MKLTCLQENLNLGLQTTGHLVNKNINLPILNNVLLEAKEGVLKLSSTNLEIGISCLVRCKVEKEGAFTIEGKLLSEYISLLPNEQVLLELDVDDFVKVSAPNSQTKIKGIIADDFPVIPQIDKQSAYKVNVKELKEAISQVIFAVASSESRPEISGVFLSFNKQEAGKLFLAGTDSYRLAEKRIDVVENKEERNVIVPVKTLQEVLRVLNNLKDQVGAPEVMDIYLSENQILFTCNNVELISRLVEGEYPDYKQIIPKEIKTTVVASTGVLTKAIKTAALFSKSGIFDISLVFDPAKGINVRATNAQVGESSLDVDVDFRGELNETTINYRYLLDGLNNVGSDLVEIGLVDGNIPCLIKPKDNAEYLYIIMPIKQ
jgi:DNA polymerase-3 subunit beta